MAAGDEEHQEKCPDSDPVSSSGRLIAGMLCTRAGARSSLRVLIAGACARWLVAPKRRIAAQTGAAGCYARHFVKGTLLHITPPRTAWRALETAEPDAAATQPALASPTSPTTRVALNDITLDVRAGELVVVTGAVGSGKSALIRALAGALAPVRIRAQRTCHYVGWLTLPAFPSSSTVLSR